MKTYHLWIVTILIVNFSHVKVHAQVKQGEPSANILVEGSNETSFDQIGPKNLERQPFQNLGETLASQPGVMASAFGAGSSRPVIRGLEGERVQIFENGLGSGDLSALSNDHAPAVGSTGVTEIELLRGPAALQYGSASPSGLINIKNSRIPQELPGGISAMVDGQYSSVDQGRRIYGMAEGQAGELALRADFVKQDASNYFQPNGQKLPFSFIDQKEFGFGGSLIKGDHVTGVSFSQQKNMYGIPSEEGGVIDLGRDKFDFQHLTKSPATGFESLEVKLGYVDYQHRELTPLREPATQFKNQQFEGRIDLKHRELWGWKGNFGTQFNHSEIIASDLASQIEGSIIPKTRSQGLSLYWLEKKSFGPFDLKLGARYEHRQVRPSSASYITDIPFSGAIPGIPSLSTRQFNLFSYSSELNWNYQPEYAFGLTYSQFARAPGVNELFAYGEHESTATFDVGNSNLTPEISRQWELAWKKTKGYIQGQVGIYQNNIDNFIYGQYTGSVDTESGFAVRQFAQAKARLQGLEGILFVNRGQKGWSGRIFGDVSKGEFTSGEFLPLQPAPRFGAEIAYQQGGWENSLTWVHAMRQTRLASFETAQTPGYDRLDARFAYNMAFNSVKASFYIQARNILNQEIRYSTTVEGIRKYAPLAGRSFVVGMRLIY